MDKNHTAIWGSYWTEGQWGYACCKQVQLIVVCCYMILTFDKTVRNAYCTGAAGREAVEEAERLMKERTAAKHEAQQAEEAEEHSRKRQRNEH